MIMIALPLSFILVSFFPPTWADTATVAGQAGASKAAKGVGTKWSTRAVVQQIAGTFINI